MGFGSILSGCLVGSSLILGANRNLADVYQIQARLALLNLIICNSPSIEGSCKCLQLAIG